MSWLYSQALVAEYLAGNYSAGGLSALSRTTPTPQAYCSPDKMTDVSRLSRYGMTFAPLTAGSGAELLTWYRAVFLVRTSALREKELVSTERAPASGRRWLELLARFDPLASTWRTVQPSLLADWGESSVIWPRSGMTADGQCWELPMSARRIKGKGSGFRPLIPTPTACDHKGSGRPRLERGPNNSLREYCKINYGLLYPPVKAAEWLMLWPLGWTDLKPLAMDKFHEWQQQHSGS